MSRRRTTNAKSGEPAARLPLDERTRPWFLAAMTALLAARLLFPSETAPDQGDGLPVVMCWLCLAIIWLLVGMMPAGAAPLAAARQSAVRRFAAVDWAMVALIAWHSAAALMATVRGSPRPALNMLWTWISFGLVFLLARQIVRTQREVRAVVAAMVALAAALSVHGCYQSRVELPALKQAYATDPDKALREAGISYAAGAPERELIRHRIEGGEATSSFILANSLGAFLAPWLFISLGMVWHARRAWSLAWRCALCAAPLAACLLLTRSRSALAATVVGIAVAAASFWLKRRIAWKHVVAVTAFVLLVAGAGLLALLSSATGRDKLSRAATSLAFRFEYWRATADMIGHAPLLGCGPGNFQDEYTRYKLPQASEEVIDPHNFLLEVWATAGTPALLALVAVLVLLAIAVRKLPADDESRLSLRESCATFAERKATMRFVFGGLLVGICWGYPLAQVSAAPPGAALWILGLPTAIACIALLAPWVRWGHCPRRLLSVAIVVLLVDLLATGGIGMPGIAQTLWLLAALALVDPKAEGLKSEAPPWAVQIGAGALVLLAVACYFTAYSQAVICPGLVRLAQREILARHYDDARSLAAEAAARDGLSAEAQRTLADAALYSWLATNDEDTYRQFSASDRRAQILAPHLASTWHASAMRHLLAYQERKDAKPRELAEEIRCLRKSVELYPTSPLYHGNLSLACEMAGDHATAKREAALALEFDKLTPHADKKLDDALRRQLETLGK